MGRLSELEVRRAARRAGEGSEQVPGAGATPRAGLELEVSRAELPAQRDRVGMQPVAQALGFGAEQNCRPASAPRCPSRAPGAAAYLPGGSSPPWKGQAPGG